MRNLQTLDEFLVVSTGRALPISNGFNSMPHLQQVLDVSRGHLWRIPNLLSLRTPLIVRLRVLLSGGATHDLIRGRAVVLR